MTAPTTVASTIQFVEGVARNREYFKNVFEDIFIKVSGSSIQTTVASLPSRHSTTRNSTMKKSISVCPTRNSINCLEVRRCRRYRNTILSQWQVLRLPCRRRALPICTGTSPFRFLAALFRAVPYRVHVPRRGGKIRWDCGQCEFVVVAVVVVLYGVDYSIMDGYRVDTVSSREDLHSKVGRPCILESQFKPKKSVFWTYKIK